MRIVRLHLSAFGPFTDRVLGFGPAGSCIEGSGTAASGAADPRLVLLYGANEAGKSSTLRAISDLRFGIPQQSVDNFVHAHPDMRIGGVFADRDGREYSLLRRKGRGATLYFDGDAAAPPEIELLLTCGLTREEYDSSFGIDHARLRKGGRDLLEGKGDVGAALFEASAGVRSVPQILESLEQSARRYFMPGARGKNASINEALRAFDLNHGQFKQALVRPAHWTELSRKHQSAADELATLEAQRADLHRRQLLIGELRAVAPLLGSLDHASLMLGQLQSVLLLSPDAATDRAAAVSGLSGARSAADAATAEVERQRARLADLAGDPAILEIRPALRRLAASMENLDRHRSDLADARAELASEAARVAEVAAGIDATIPMVELVEHAPGPTTAAGVEQLLVALERADQALEQHRQAIDQHDPDTPGALCAELPSAEARTALRIARADLDRSDAPLKRLAGLPAEIESARRAAQAALAPAGLGDEASLRRLRPLLDSQIDEARQLREHNETRRGELTRRIDEISTALRKEIERRDRLLEQGPVPTVDDVHAARSHRDGRWATVRATYIDATKPPAPGLRGDRPLADAYEQAVAAADRLADEVARDTDRAAQLHSCRRTIGVLEYDRDELRRELDGIDRDRVEHETEWQRMLAAAQLPVLSPRALRDWQALLPAARDACDTLQERLDEFAQLRAIERSLATSLREAITATGLAAPAPQAPLRTLSTTAAEVENEIRQREKNVDTAAGKRQQNEQHRRRLVEIEARLAVATQEARAALEPALAGLLLDGNATPAMARARLGEFRELKGARDRVGAAEARQRRAAQALAVLEEAVAAVARTLGEPAPVDARLCIERLAARLDAAETIEAARAAAQAALDHALENVERCRRAAADHERRLAELCQAARVDEPEQLPDAEERSRRKREAQTEFDRSSAQLVQASRRPVDELRSRLRDYDAARMDADEAAMTREQQQLDERLRAARQREEAARRALEAIDSTDAAAAAREAMEQAAARVRAATLPWIRTRLAHGLLAEALKRFRDRAQGPMLQSASEYFSMMTGNEFTRLVSDASSDRPLLLAERRTGARLHVEAMSEGTRDQLYLALRLAALQLRRAAGVDLPVILDDVLMTADDERTRLMLQTLAEFSRAGQVIVFTHHRHVARIAAGSLPANALTLVDL